jgi:cysteine synthase A
MLAEGQRGSVVTLICDGGDRYAGTYYDDAWVADQGMDLGPYEEALESFLEQGAFPAARVGPRPR